MRVPAAEIATDDVNLDRKNPGAAVVAAHLPPEHVVEDIVSKERRILALPEDIRLTLIDGAGSIPAGAELTRTAAND